MRLLAVLLVALFCAVAAERGYVEPEIVDSLDATQPHAGGEQMDTAQLPEAWKDAMNEGEAKDEAAAKAKDEAAKKAVHDVLSSAVEAEEEEEDDAQDGDGEEVIVSAMSKELRMAGDPEDGEVAVETVTPGSRPGVDEGTLGDNSTPAAFKAEKKEVKKPPAAKPDADELLKQQMQHTASRLTALSTAVSHYKRLHAKLLLHHAALRRQRKLLRLRREVSLAETRRQQLLTSQAALARSKDDLSRKAAHLQQLQARTEAAARNVESRLAATAQRLARLETELAAMGGDLPSHDDDSDDADGDADSDDGVGKLPTLLNSVELQASDPHVGSSHDGSHADFVKQLMRLTPKQLLETVKQEEQQEEQKDDVLLHEVARLNGDGSTTTVRTSGGRKWTSVEVLDRPASDAVPDGVVGQVQAAQKLTTPDADKAPVVDKVEEGAAGDDEDGDGGRETAEAMNDMKADIEAEEEKLSVGEGDEQQLVKEAAADAAAAVADKAEPVEED